MPERVGEFGEKISQYTKCKLPAFFRFAKDKGNNQIEAANNSMVNKLYSIIPNKPINTRGLKLEKINYKKLMNNINIVCSSDVLALYNKLNKEYRYKINMKDEYVDNLHYIACSIRAGFTELGYSEETIADMLVHYLYGNEKRNKQLLWFCYGQYIASNLEKNIVIKKTRIIQCIDCGELLEVDIKDNSTNRCYNCYSNHRKNYKAEKERLRRQSIS